MKKLFLLLSAVFALSTTTFAQRIAVVDFNAGVGISQQDVDGIAAIFNTYFSPSGYTLVERTTIDRVIDEQQFQRGKITEQQMVRLGQILNVSKIVIGDVNVVAGEYNIDVRVVNVESGTIAAKDGATWMQGSTYRTLMKGLATRLANQVAISPQSSPVVASGLKIGDIYEANGKKGVVFAVSGDGKHGRIISIQETKCGWDAAKTWCAQLGDGWRLPTKQELLMICKLKENTQFNEGLFWADSPEMKWDCWYWTGEVSDRYCAWLVSMHSGNTYDGDKSAKNFVRAVSAF